MIFASLLFLFLFLPLNLILYYSVPNLSAKNAVLIGFSLLFYAWGEPVWVFLMLLTAFLDYTHAKTIEKHRGTFRAKAALLMSVFTDVGIFIVFKYTGFFAENLNLIPGLSLPVPQIALPIGISFYTFQTLTYIIDVYRGKISAQPLFSKYLLYLSLYFQLVAGPIVRYTDVQREIERRNLSIPRFSQGVYKFAMGLGKKVILANSAGVFVDKFMMWENSYTAADLTSLTTLGAWFGIIMYTLQLYFDFSGYSDMAIGLGKMFGFDFPENFNYPYISRSVSEFWRRWHMTLGSFFRDYVYIPLGGNKKHVYRNLFVVWFLTGFWHGASWNFIIWGLLNGAFIMLERMTKPFFEKIPSFIQHIYLLVFVNVGFVFFRFSDLSKAWQYLKRMFGSASEFTNLELNSILTSNMFWIIICILFSMPIMKFVEKLYYRSANSPVAVNTIFNTLRLILIFAVILFSVSHLTGNSFNPFLYNAF